jgi:hypothetical protein
LPLPGGPTSSRLWPPAAAISSARFAWAWPFTSRRSGPGGVGASGCGSASGKGSACGPAISARTTSSRCRAARGGDPPATAASAALDAGSTSRARAALAPGGERHRQGAAHRAQVAGQR